MWDTLLKILQLAGCTTTQCFWFGLTGCCKLLPATKRKQCLTSVCVSFHWTYVATCEQRRKTCEWWAVLVSWLDISRTIIRWLPVKKVVKPTNCSKLYGGAMWVLRYAGNYAQKFCAANKCSKSWLIPIPQGLKKRKCRKINLYPAPAGLALDLLKKEICYS